MSKFYQKKPVIVEAKQFLGTWQSWDEINYWITGAWLEEHTIVENIDWSTYEIKTLEGVMVASTGDYIVKGVQGEFYPCKPDIFKQTYKPEDEAWTREEQKKHAAEWTRQYNKGFEDGLAAAIKALQKADSACSDWAVGLVESVTQYD